MPMQALMSYLEMGGYAAYVWPAYALAITVMGGFFLHGLWRYRRGQRTLEEIQRTRPARSRHGRP
jgi:heme exporter protein D